MPTSIVAIAGANGDLGGLLTAALIARGAAVRALLRPDATPAIVRRAKLNTLDNHRYPELRWTSVKEMFHRRQSTPRS